MEEISEGWSIYDNLICESESALTLLLFDIGTFINPLKRNTNIIA